MAFMTPNTPAEPVEAPARKKTKSEFAGGGALVQVLGLLVIWIFPIGTFCGLAALVIGSQMSKKTICTRCGNRVEKTSQICPHCQSHFEN